MVLIGRSTAAALLIPILMGTTATAGQEMDSVSNAPASSILEIPDSLFVPTTLSIAGAPVQIGGTVGVEYDNNLYAQAFDTVDDEKLLVRPRIALLPSSGALQLSALAEGDFRKFRRRGSEDTIGGLIKTETIWTPSATDRVTLLSGWQRITEDRGEPEGLTTRRTGPRQINTIDADLGYTMQGPRFFGALRRHTVMSTLSTATVTSTTLCWSAALAIACRRFLTALQRALGNAAISPSNDCRARSIATRKLMAGDWALQSIPAGRCAVILRRVSTGSPRVISGSTVVPGCRCRRRWYSGRGHGPP